MADKIMANKVLPLLADSGSPIDEQYYEVAAPRSWGERLAVVARDRIYADILRHCRPASDETILDVGVSDVVTDAANMLERKYSHPERITAVGLGEEVAAHRAAIGVVTGRVVPEPEEHLLDDLLGQRRLHQQSPGEPEDGAGVAAIRLGQRALVVAGDGQGEGAVGGVIEPVRHCAHSE